MQGHASATCHKHTTAHIDFSNNREANHSNGKNEKKNQRTKKLALRREFLHELNRIDFLLCALCVRPFIRRAFVPLSAFYYYDFYSGFAFVFFFFGFCYYCHFLVFILLFYFNFFFFFSHFFAATHQQRLQGFG